MSSKGTRLINLGLNEVQKIEMALRIYAITIFKKVITPKEVEFLRDYLINGYNEQTRLGLELKYSRQNIHTTNCSLQKKGFLKPKPYKQDKELHPKLEEIRTDFIINKQKFILLNFE